MASANLSGKSRATAQTVNGPGSFYERLRAAEKDPVLRRIRPKGMPILFGNENLEMGEASIHTATLSILLFGLTYHFARLTGYRVFSNLNLYYSEDDPTRYVSPDIMVVKPPRRLPEHLPSYQIRPQRPAPQLVGEVLSVRTWQQGDLTDKPLLYSDLGIAEYLLADVTGEMLEERLLLLRRKPQGGWTDEQDEDGGITSRLGFRVVLEADGQLRVLDARTGKRYVRPDEAQAEAEARQRAEERIRALEAELNRLRSSGPSEPPPKGTRKRRKKP